MQITPSRGRKAISRTACIKEPPKNRLALLKRHRMTPLVILVVISLLYILPNQSLPLWEDNFNDGDLTGWNIQTYYTRNFNRFPVVRGQPLIANVNKRMVVPDGWNGTHGTFNVAERNSTQVTGHWSFDIDTTKGSWLGFMFIYHDPTPETDFADEGWYNAKPNGFEGYGVLINTEIKLVRMNANFTNTGEYRIPLSEVLLDEVMFQELGYSFSAGTFHFDITRTPAGNITVWVDNTKVLSAISTNYTISDTVHISNFAGVVKFDNIHVCDEYDGPHPNGTSSWTLPIAIGSLMVLLIIRYRKKQPNS